MSQHPILIADAGSTKSEWALIDHDGSVSLRFTTHGLNALLAGAEERDSLFSSVMARISASGAPAEVHYYGAGCATPQICSEIVIALKKASGADAVSVDSDLLGAARSLLGDTKGIACILGTGSNSCLYDGRNISANIPSLGYILGDEGSGAALGKRLLSDAFKGHLPASVRESFSDTFKLTLPDILHKVYSASSPNKFLASLVPFIKDNLWNPYIYSLVLEELTSFIKRNVAMYPGAHSLPVSFTGGIASAFETQLREAAASQGYEISCVTKSPMDGLVNYHGHG